MPRSPEPIVFGLWFYGSLFPETKLDKMRLAPSLASMSIGSLSVTKR